MIDVIFMNPRFFISKKKPQWDANACVCMISVMLHVY